MMERHSDHTVFSLVCGIMSSGVFRRGHSVQFVHTALYVMSLRLAFFSAFETIVYGTGSASAL